MEPPRGSEWFNSFRQTAGGSDTQKSHGSPLLHLVGSVRLFLPDDGQRVGLRVEDPVVKREVVVVGEKQVEILERLGQVEALLNVVVVWRRGVDVSDAAVASF